MKNKRNVRRIVQIFFFILIGSIAINKTLAEAGKGIALLSTASLHALCPFGGVVSLYQWITLGTFVQKIHESSMVLMGLIFLLALLFGPVFCGWICPFGSIQEWMGRLGKRIFKKRYNHFIPSNIDRKLRFIRYGVLLWVIYVTAKSGYLLFATIDPYYALFNFWTGEVAIAGIIALSIILITSLFIERPWCKYTCPYGALLGLSNKIRLFSIRRNTNTCMSCNQCNKSCPMNLEISNQEKITDSQCISCYECTSERSCPIGNAVGLNRKNQFLKEDNVL